MPRGWIRFTGLIIFSLFAHAILIWALQRAAVLTPSTPKLEKKPIQARLIVMKQPPAPQPPLENEPALAQKPEPEPIEQAEPEAPEPPIDEAVATEQPEQANETTLPELSPQTQQRMNELLQTKPNISSSTPTKRSGLRRFIPDSLSTASLPEHLQNKPPVERRDTHEFNKPEGTITYPKSSDIAEEYRLADGSTLMRMKSGRCVLVQDQQQLDPQLNGKVWLSYGGAGCKQDDESLAWKAFKQRIAKHAQR
ncbi:hypothetical protein K0504_14375 [Neiella marina]|uniref:Uncharacterized protein n=1 Tax=Neiella holothuriorum TaxID=2870530 RepID=A0ABS7EIP4_9GAMM|nr:hypothetical protein [Neiella holothuriorum]MBW8192219.1 hypothetical protein [Neiella holothuriorum]